MQPQTFCRANVIYSEGETFQADILDITRDLMRISITSLVDRQAAIKAFKCANAKCKYCGTLIETFVGKSSEYLLCTRSTMKSIHYMIKNILINFGQPFGGGLV